MKRRIFVIAQLILVLILPSCNWIPGTGYRLFRSNVEGFHISFEYPFSWQAGRVQTTLNGTGVFILIGGNSSMTVSSELTKATGGTYDNASELMNSFYSQVPRVLESKVLNWGKVKLGNTEAQELIFSSRLYVTAEYDPHLPVGTVIDKIVVQWQIATDYKERIYFIQGAVDQEQYDKVKPNLDHLLSTFKFLDQ